MVTFRSYQTLLEVDKGTGIMHNMCMTRFCRKKSEKSSIKPERAHAAPIVRNRVKLTCCIMSRVKCVSVVSLFTPVLITWDCQDKKNDSIEFLLKKVLRQATKWVLEKIEMHPLKALSHIKTIFPGNDFLAKPHFVMWTIFIIFFHYN